MRSKLDRMRILAINCGSSSLKCAVIAERPPRRVFELYRETADYPDAATAIDALLAELRGRWLELGDIDAVVHRVVHGGESFKSATLVDETALAEIAKLEHLAPLHNPPAVRAIRGTLALFNRVPHVVVFDTAFHATLPRHAFEYALPDDLRSKFGLRRYGFHGISHADVAVRVAAALGRGPRDLRIVSCHLGSGASVAAIERGCCVDTSMGMTPLEGLLMGTRPGDVDPGIVLALARALPAAELDDLLNRRSGLVGLCGTQDIREIERRAEAGEESCRFALEIYTYRVRKYIGAYAGAMGGVDAIAFTGGVGERSAAVRRRCVQNLEFLGAISDESRNANAHVDAQHPSVDVAVPESRVRIVVLHADEESAMAVAARGLLVSSGALAVRQRIPVAVSARHAHLSQATIERLFGAGYRLHPRNALSQPGQFSAQETVKLVGPCGRLERVRLMGPPRERDQIEISRGDGIALGIDAPVRMSGDLDDTPAIGIEGPAGRAKLAHGVICAKRHVHMNPDDAVRLGVTDGDVIAVRVDSDGRDVVFEDVGVRVSPAFTLELHLDTDEANAARIEAGARAEIVRPRK